LIKGKFLMTASSGGGKSNLIRIFCERLFGHVPIIILDREGEFGNLRNVCKEFIVFGKEGDMPIHAGMAHLLALRLWENKYSAIIDLSEMEPSQMHRFVQVFIKSLVDAPKNIWRPMVLVIDEAHEFVPENGEGSSVAKGAILELISKCRKRFIGVVLASQRAAKLDKSAISECRNLVVGFLNRHDDRRQLGKELGFSTKDELFSIKMLHEGEFWALGPAIAREVTKVQIDLAETNPSDNRLTRRFKIGKPSAETRALLDKLKDLPKEAEKELTEVVDLKAENMRLRTELKKAGTIKPEIRIQKESVDIKGIQESIENQYRHSCRIWQGQLLTLLHNIRETVGNTPWKPPVVKLPVTVTHKTTVLPINPFSTKPVVSPFPVQRTTEVEHLKENTDSGLGPSETKILGFLCLHPQKQFKRSQISAMIGMKCTGGSFKTYMSRLRSRGFITGRDLYQITEQGIHTAQSLGIESTQGLKVSLESWLEKLPGNPRKIYEVCLNNPHKSFSTEEISQAAQIQCTGGSFKTYVSRLVTLGLLR